MFRETKMFEFLEFSSSKPDVWSLVKLYQKTMRKIVPKKSVSQILIITKVIIKRKHQSLNSL